MFANYFATKLTKFVVISKDCSGRVEPIKINVSGKAEARKIAATYNAKVWNF